MAKNTYTPVNPFPSISLKYKIYSGIFKIRELFSGIFFVTIVILLFSPTVLYRHGLNNPNNKIFSFIKNYEDVWILTGVIATVLFFVCITVFITAAFSSNEMISFLQYKLERTGQIEIFVNSHNRYEQSREKELEKLHLLRKKYQEMLNDLIACRRFKKRSIEAKRGFNALQARKPARKRDKKEPYAL